MFNVIIMDFFFFKWQLRMAKKPSKVKDFLKSLAAKLQPIWKKEREEMLEMKKAEVLLLGRVMRY